MDSTRTNSGLSKVERHFLARAQLMFQAYPELISFWLEEESDPFDGLAALEQDADRFDLHVTLATDVSEDFQQELCGAVTEFLADILRERPEALEVLVGRTFARALH